jgi:hypothetical protein
MDNSSPVKITHDIDVIKAHQHAFEQMDYFKMKFSDNKDSAKKFLVKVGFGVSRDDKGPVTPISTIQEQDPRSIDNHQKESEEVKKERVDTEWMWVVIKGWKGSKISGAISNEPFYRKDLKLGTNIEFKEDTVMDWIIMKDENVLEGNFLEKVLTSKGTPLK